MHYKGKIKDGRNTWFNELHKGNTKEMIRVLLL